MKVINVDELKIKSNNVRINILKMINSAKTSHIGSSLSSVELLVYLYNSFLNINPESVCDENRDRFLFSKGHACSALYAVLAELNFIEKKELDYFACNGNLFMTHANSEIQGIELSTGSLGHALPVGLGISLTSKLKNEKWKTVVMISDGELEEGSNWESFLMAHKLKLNNLYVIIDYNKIQALGRTNDVIGLEPLKDKFDSFGWEVGICDGHDFNEINDNFEQFENSKLDKPKILIANTVKGKGISFMEDKLLWHYKSPSEAEFKLAMKELEK